MVGLAVARGTHAAVGVTGLTVLVAGLTFGHSSGSHEEVQGLALQAYSAGVTQVAEVQHCTA